MSNMSYCRHENTASDLQEVVAEWGEWAEENATSTDPDPTPESRARRRIMRLAVALVREMEDKGLLDDADKVRPLAEFATIYPEA